MLVRDPNPVAPWRTASGGRTPEQAGRGRAGRNDDSTLLQHFFRNPEGRGPARTPTMAAVSRPSRSFGSCAGWRKVHDICSENQLGAGRNVSDPFDVG